MNSGAEGLVDTPRPGAEDLGSSLLLFCSETCKLLDGSEAKRFPASLSRLVYLAEVSNVERPKNEMKAETTELSGGFRRLLII